MKQERNWIDINESKDRKFVELNNENTKHTFTPINENQKLDIKSECKVNVLLRTVFDALIKSNKCLLNEASNNDNNFFLTSTQTWNEFKNQVKLIGSLLALEDDKINIALQKIETVFKDVSGDLNKGAEDFNKLNTYLYGNKSPIKGLEPQLSIQQIFNAITSGDETKNDFIKFFKYMIMPDNDKAKFMDVIANDRSIASSLESQLSEMHVDIDSVLNAFSTITKMDNFRKNNNSVGKGEVAIALFFGDAKLAQDEGDIELTSGGKYEIKVNEGSITRRLSASMFPPSIFGKSGNWRKFKNIQPPKELEQKVIEQIKQEKIKATDDEKLKELLSFIDLTAAKMQWNISVDEVNSLKFRVLFSAAFSSYPQSYEAIIVLNTYKQNFSINSPLFQEVPVKIRQTNSNNWYKNGLDALTTLPPKINIRFATISGKSEVTFKAIFLAK